MTPNIARVLVLAVSLVLSACADDDGAKVRDTGSVVVVGPAPPGGGGSVSAVGTGCTTRGGTTRLAAATVQIGLDEYSVTVPDTVTAGVNRVVVKNFGSDSHELVIARADSVEELAVAGDSVDVDALTNEVYRILEFPGNTICQGTFNLSAGNYVVFSNLATSDGSDFSRGMVATLVVS